MRAEQGAERSKLKPTQVELGSELPGGHEATDVRAPKRNAAKRSVDRDGYLSLQRLPRGEDVARPQERPVTLHPGVAVPMQRIGAFVGTVNLWPLPIHPVSRQPRRNAHRIAFVRTPAIHSHGEILAVRLPIASGLFLVEARQRTCIACRASQLVRENDRVQHHPALVAMYVLDL